MIILPKNVLLMVKFASTLVPIPFSSYHNERNISDLRRERTLHSLLLPKSAAPGPVLSIWTPATLASQVVRQQQPCCYSNMSVTVMKWILPRRKTICQALTQEVEVLLWRLVFKLIGTMRSIRKCQTFVLPDSYNSDITVYFFLKNLTSPSFEVILIAGLDQIT